jgi:hypothetical protein
MGGLVARPSGAANPGASAVRAKCLGSGARRWRCGKEAWPRPALPQRQRLALLPKHLALTAEAPGLAAKLDAGSKGAAA